MQRFLRRRHEETDPNGGSRSQLRRIRMSGTPGRNGNLQHRMLPRQLPVERMERVHSMLGHLRGRQHDVIALCRHGSGLRWTGVPWRVLPIGKVQRGLLPGRLRVERLAGMGRVLEKLRGRRVEEQVPVAGVGGILRGRTLPGVQPREGVVQRGRLLPRRLRHVGVVRVLRV